MTAGSEDTDGFHHIGTILKTLLSSSRKDDDGDLVEIWRFWDEIVGRVVAENAQPEAFKGKLLLVRVGSSPWAHHLRFLKSDIIAKINKALGQDLVEEIRFKVG